MGCAASWALPLAVAVGGEADLLAQAIMSPGPTWAEKLGAISDGLWGWYRTALAQGTTYDPLVFAAVVGLVGFLLGFCCAWLVFRLQTGWLALVLCAAAGIVHLSYATVESIPPFFTSIFLGVLMVASLELHLRRSTWRAIGVPVRPPRLAGP